MWWFSTKLSNPNKPSFSSQTTFNEVANSVFCLQIVQQGSFELSFGRVATEQSGVIVVRFVAMATGLLWVDKIAEHSRL